MPESFWVLSWRWIKRYVLAPLPAILIVAGAILLVILGAKNIQIGGLLGKLFGHKKPEGQKAIEVVNSVPEDRIDPNGKVIPIGTPDAKGITQAEVVPIEQPGIFSNPDQVVIKKGEETVVVDLPEGIQAKDVDKVIIVKPEVLAVTVKDSSKVDTRTVDDLLTKYGS